MGGSIEKEYRNMCRKIDRIRIRKKISLADISRATGVTSGQLSYFFNNKHDMTTEKWFKVVCAIGLKVDVRMRDEEE